MDGQLTFDWDDSAHTCWAADERGEIRWGKCHRCEHLTRQRALRAACDAVNEEIRLALDQQD